MVKVIAALLAYLPAKEAVSKFFINVLLEVSKAVTYRNPA